METILADDQFIIEYRLLDIYHRKRKARLSASFQDDTAKYLPQGNICGWTSTRTRVPSFVKTAKTAGQPFNTASFMGVAAKYPQQSEFWTSTRTRVPASVNTDAFEYVADKLTDIVDSGPPAQDQVVTEIDVIQRLVELLKEYGDQVNEKIMKDTELIRYLQGLVSFNLFENLASAFIRSMMPPGKPRGKENHQKTKIAWIFEMTSRLSALDLQPMNRTMGFGAQYLHKFFGPWIQQHGGWENAFKIDGGDEVQ